MAAVTFTGTLPGAFATGIGTVTLTVASATPTEDVVAAVTGAARLTVGAPAPKPVHPDLRTRPSISATYRRPVIINGRPSLPRFFGLAGQSGTASRGSGHIRAFPDPDPVWGGSSWVVEPPAFPEGANFIRWTAKSLPNPAGFPGGSYRLGDASALDGTTGIASGATRWNSAAGSSVSIPWRSAVPFKPVVQPHVHLGFAGQNYTESVGVHFDANHVQHMWADMGSFLTPPFTIILVAVMTAFSTARPWNYVTDAGVDQSGTLTDAQKRLWLANGVPDGVRVSENEGYRTGLRVGRTQFQMYSDVNPTTRIGKQPYANRYRPQMFGLVFNGGSSAMYDYGIGGTRTRRVGLANHGSQRQFLLGRANTYIDPRFASSMVVFEMRVWDKVLTPAQMKAQYDQLSTTWRFHAYK